MMEFWSVNINNFHWVSVFHKNANGANVYCMDSLGGLTNLPDDLITQPEKFTSSSKKPSHLKHIDQAHAKPGDLIVYGHGTGHHVVVIVEAGTDPLVASHGSERGPNLVRHSDETRWQIKTPGVTFLQTV